MHYKKVTSHDSSFNYQSLISDVFTKIPAIAQRSVIRGEKTIQFIKLKRSEHYGIYIHLTSYIEGEQASTIKKTNKDPDLGIVSAPDGEEFMDGDIHALISNNNLLFCASGASRESSIKDYFDALFEKAQISRPEYVIKTPVKKQVLDMLSAGVKEINLDAHATALELNNIKRSNSRYLTPIKNIIEILTLKERSLEEIGGLDGLMFGIHINSQGRINPDSDSQAVIQAAGKGIIEEELSGFSIITRDGSKITHDSISYKHTKSLERYGKTVWRDDAWNALTEFMDKLLEQRVIKT